MYTGPIALLRVQLPQHTDSGIAWIASIAATVVAVDQGINLLGLRARHQLSCVGRDSALCDYC